MESIAVFRKKKSFMKYRLYNKFNSVICYVIRLFQKQLELDGKYGYLTIFHDYESFYAQPGVKEQSYYGVNRMLDIEKKYNVRTTYNTVGKLGEDLPEVINRIINEGHELAGHSYDHSFLAFKSKSKTEWDLKKTMESFLDYGVKIKGMRSPKGRWSFGQMRLMAKLGMTWSAEGDKAKYPYFIIPNKLLRFPVKIGDHKQYRKFKTPEAVTLNYLKIVDELIENKGYGAMCFHPWVIAESEERLEAYDGLLREITKKQNLKIVTFSEMCDLIKKFNKLS
ncbi:MAG: polysaccharide deacetylase family protein [Bacteroidia bacterium]|nr:polysaccharide deacetylase family protein [Bacteroidia bacterium]